MEHHNTSTPFVCLLGGGFMLLCGFLVWGIFHTLSVYHP